MPALNFPQLGTAALTFFCGVWTALMKKAPAGQIDGAGDLAHGLHRFHQRFLSDGWHSREKQAGIRVNRIVEQCVFVPHLHNGAQIHNSQPVADIFYNREVMRDEQIGKAEFVLQIHHQVQYLCLDRDVQRRNRLVGNNKFRLHSKCPGDTDPVLPPGL